jgi:hypothetical protein
MGQQKTVALQKVRETLWHILVVPDRRHHLDVMPMVKQTIINFIGGGISAL